MSTQPQNTPDQDGRDQVIKGHKYDGIKEYDNPMPGWWVWLFWGTFVFSIIYVLGIRVFDFVDTYEEDLAQGLAELEMVRESYAAANPTFEVSEEELAAYIGDPDAIASGADQFQLVCAACHGEQGQGLIGPNLTDAYWVHGGSNVDIFNVLTEGVVEKGMPAWEGQLTPEQRAHLVAFLESIEGSDPPGAKAPEGDLYEPAS